MLVFYRCVFAVATLGLALVVTRRLVVLRKRATMRYALLLGTTPGVQWLLFFETIKLSSVVLRAGGYGVRRGAHSSGGE